MNDIVKAILYAFLFFVIVFSVPFFILFSPEISSWINSLTHNQWVEKSVNLDKFNQNPESYLGKYVTVMGKFDLTSEGYMNCNRSVNTLTDKNNFKIKICIEDETLQVGKSYTLKGIIVMDTSKSTNEKSYILKVDSQL